LYRWWLNIFTKCHLYTRWPACLRREAGLRAADGQRDVLDADGRVGRELDAVDAVAGGVIAKKMLVPSLL